MAILMQMDLPVSKEDVEAVSADLGTHESPPDGLIFHVVTETANGVHVADVWESRDAFEKFNADRLTPAMQKAIVDRRIPMDGPPPEPSFDEAFDVVRGR